LCAHPSAASDEAPSPPGGDSALSSEPPGLAVVSFVWSWRPLAHAFRIGASIHAPKLQFAGTIVKMGLVTSFVAVCNATSKCMDTTQVDEVDIVMRELLGAASAARADSEVQQGAVSGGPPSDSESSSEDEDEDDLDDSPGGDEPFTTPVWGLRPGPAKHDLLGAGTIIAIHDSEQTLSGITVAFSAQNAGKVLFKWSAKEGRQWKEKQRWVFADACEQEQSAQAASGSANASADEDDHHPTAFDEMLQGAAQPRAFTQGLTEPELAAHERKRKVTRLKEAPVRGRNKLGRKTKEPVIAPLIRVEAFPNQSLAVENGKLRCKACKYDCSLRKSSLKAHLSSVAHKEKLEKYFDSLVDDDDLAGLITRFYEKNPDTQGATVATDTHVYRWHVMESLMYAGIPYAKADMIRPLLEHASHPLTDSRNLGRTYIPLIQERELKRLRKELLKQWFALIFDGTTRLGEAINMVTRSITDEFQICMRLIAFKTLKVHVDGPGLYRLILKTLQMDLGLNLDDCVAWGRDSCATNGVAVDNLMPHSTNAVSMLCFSHTLHNSGKHLKLSVLDEFMTAWLQLVAQPGAAKLRWQAILGGSMASYSKVRWWSRWDIMNEIATNFGAIPPFIASLDADGIGDATTQKMLDVVTNRRSTLELELAAVMSCERLCKAT
jgi:hypothetical protein